MLECFLMLNGPVSVRNGLWHIIENGRMWIGITEEGSGYGHLLLELLWKEAALIIYCWNYCRKKHLWSFTAGITVERSSFGHVLLELL